MKVAFITRSTLYKIHGGSAVQIIELAKQLRQLGVEVTICLAHEKINYDEFDLLHFFDITRPANILYHINRSNKPFVVSPILVDYSEYDRYHRKGLSGFILKFFSSDANEYIKTIARWVSGKDTLQSKNYIWKGQKRSIREILRKSKLVLPNSEMENQRLKERYGIDKSHFVIPYCIDTGLFRADHTIVKDEAMVACAARVEGLKNQLNLIRALNNTAFKLLLIGNASPNQKRYFRKCKNIAAPNVVFIENLPQQELITHYQKAKVHILPSWFETCGLSSLEAASLGCNLVISDKGFSKEYFGEEAFYCDPGDVNSIFNAVTMAAKAPLQTTLQKKILENYTWEQAAAKTLEAYKTIRDKNNCFAKIGIDAKWLYSGVISGRLFIQNVLPELISLHPEIEWHVFLNRKDKREDKLFDKKNVKTHYVWAGVNMLSNLFVLPRYARKLKLDAVFFQTFSPRAHSYKSVVFTHDILARSHPNFFSFKENLYLSPLRRTISSADKIITTTEFVKNELLKYKYVNSPSKIDLAPSGITSCYKPAKEHDPVFLQSVNEKYHLPASYLLFTGRINKRKNVQGLLTAMTLLSDKQIPLIIVGEADSKQADLKKILSNPALKNRVCFTGAVPDEELSAIYAMATVFCFPSFAEGFGLPPLEAMASGVPVIVSNTTSMPEACGNAAVFVNPGDPQSIAAAIEELLVNKNLREQKIAEGIAWSAQYTWKRTAEQIMRGIFQAIGK